MAIRQALVARSSSVVEDMATSSMAGQFESIIGVRELRGVHERSDGGVADSRRRAGAAEHPIAVLVQPLIEPAYGGVMFGIDPVSGRTDRRVVSAVQGGPEPLVSGEVDGSRYMLDSSNAKVLDFTANDGPQLKAADLRRLVELSTTVASVYGTPRTSSGPSPRTTGCGCCSRASHHQIQRCPPRPHLRPWTVAETFPSPLTELDTTCRVPPLREAVREAVMLAGSATEVEVAASDVVVCVDGHVAIDLRLAGRDQAEDEMVSKFEPGPGGSSPPRSVEGREAAFGASPLGRASARPHRR